MTQFKDQPHFFRDMSFFITEAFIGMKRSGVMIFISVATITVSLIVFGLFLLISANINNLANFISSKLEIRVYLKDGIQEAEVEVFRQRILHMNGVKDVIFIDHDTAWKQFKSNFKNIELTDVMSNNPLPDTFHVYLQNTDSISNLSSYLKTFPQVEDVGYMGPIAERVKLFSKVTKIAGLVLVGLLTVATLLITINTIRLTVIARQNEIAIMNLVGATSDFIRWPFIIEGLFMGVAGSFVAVIFLKASYLFFSVKLQNLLPYFPLVFDSFILSLVYLAVFVLGAILGIVGAYISVSRTLKSV